VRPKKLQRTREQRKALFRGLVTSVLENEQVETTESKAKAARPIIEKMITLGKKGDLNARRRVAGYLNDDAVVKKVFDVLAERYEDRTGGYTRIMKKGPRRGDGAPMVIIELV